MSKKVNVYFDFKMSTCCPHCGEDVDFDAPFYNDEGEWTEKFKAWINNVGEDINEEVECSMCDKTFFIEKICR